MQLNEYQAHAASVPWEDCNETPEDVAWALALGGEAGELQNNVKKRSIFHNQTSRHDVQLSDVIDEAGDVLGCLAMVCEKHGFTLQQAAQASMNKMEDRYAVTAPEPEG